MNRFPSTSIRLLLGCCFLHLTTAVFADFVVPAGVSATSYYNTNAAPLSLINGTVTDASTVLTSNGSGIGNWYGAAFSAGGPNALNVAGSAPVVDNQSLTFTLPGVYDLQSIYLWQMNQTSLYGRGINQYDLSVSSDGITYVPIQSNVNLNIAAGGVSAQTQALAANGVRFVRLDVDTAHSGAANEYVGLNEVRFEGTLVSQGPKPTISVGATSASLPFQPSSTDLLQGKVGTASRTIATGNLGMLTDGIGDNSLSHRVLAADNAAQTSNPFTLTYDAAALGLGADQSLSINMLNVFSYNTDGRRWTDFDLQYTTDGTTWQYAFIGASNVGLAGGVTLTSLTIDGTTNFLTNVRGLRFDFRPVSGTQQSTLIEIDALGSVVTIPEPGMLGLGLGLMTFASGLYWRRRR